MTKLFIAALLTLSAVFTTSQGLEQILTPTMDGPHIVITKRTRTLELFNGNESIKRYKIALGSSPKGDKAVQGDGKTPEGEFYVFTKNDQSKFYLSLGLSYPNREDAKRGLAAKLITDAQYDAIIKAVDKKEMPPQDTRLGGEIYIHGGGIDTDWTIGCVAMRNDDMKELFDAATVGMPVTILP